MRLLLFLISITFSFLFYSFHLLLQWKWVFWNIVAKPEVEILPISGSFLIESTIFLVLAFLLLVAFTPLSKDTKKIDKGILYYSLFYLFLLIPLYFWLFSSWKMIILILLIFVFWDLSFNLLSNIKTLKEQKINIRYFWLGLNYLSVALSIMYIFLYWLSYYIFLISIYNIIFNYKIHKKYTNYISLLISFILTSSIIYYLFLLIKKLYIFYMYH